MTIEADKLAECLRKIANVDSSTCTAAICQVIAIEALRAYDAHRAQGDGGPAEQRASLLPLDKRCADALADEVAVLVRRGVIDARSPAADALLDYRNPPSSPRADRLAQLEQQAAHPAGTRCDECGGDGYTMTAGGRPEDCWKCCPEGTRRVTDANRLRELFRDARKDSQSMGFESIKDLLDWIERHVCNAAIELFTTAHNELVEETAATVVWKTRALDAEQRLAASHPSGDVERDADLVLVPREPTREMIDAYQSAFISDKRFDMREVWNAMIAAAIEQRKPDEARNAAGPGTGMDAVRAKGQT